MKETVYEGVVENGKIRLKPDVTLPEKAKVYIVVSDTKLSAKKVVQILLPHFARWEDAARFKLTVVEDKPK